MLLEYTFMKFWRTFAPLGALVDVFSRMFKARNSRFLPQRIFFGQVKPSGLLAIVPTSGAFLGFFP
jgi:hypothetical protein